MKRSVRVLLLIFILSLFLQISLYALYNGTIATLDKLDTAISMGIYDGSTTLTFTEPFEIVGINQNKTIPVDWVAIGVSYGDSGTYYPRSMYLTANEVNYQIYDSISSGNILLEKADATTLDDLITIYVGGLKRRFTLDSSFEVEIPSSQVVTNGIYEDISLTFELWGLLDLTGTGPHTPLVFSDLNNMYLLDSLSVTVSTTVDSSLLISVIDRGGAFTFTATPYSMDFGTMDPGETMLADVIIESTVSYSIDVESQNGGRLKHTTVAEYVDYTFLFNGSPVTLTGSSNLVSNSTKSFHPGDRYPVDIQLAPTIGFIPAGDYTDNLTFTITAN